jgi:hypothetical protein
VVKCAVEDRCSAFRQRADALDAEHTDRYGSLPAGDAA